MTDKIEVQSPVEVKDNSKERVALDLMSAIAANEGKSQAKDSRKYWLTLYHQCWKATSGHQLESILREE